MSAITSLVKENIGILSGSKTTDDCMWRGGEGRRGGREGGEEGGREGGEERGREGKGREGGEEGGREGKGREGGDKNNLLQ